MSNRRIWQDAQGYVHLREMEWDGTEIEHQYWVPRQGGYVRDVLTDNGQVCAGLSTRGWALSSSPERLLELIRKEWRRIERQRRREEVA